MTPLRQRMLEDMQIRNHEYFHVVFTVPQDVAALVAHNKATVYNLIGAGDGRDLANHRR